jgi:flagellar biosynthesis protein FlhG
METRENQKMPRIICVSSGKGGVGKTSISVNTAVALSQAGKRVLVVDGDLGLANVDIVLGLSVKHTLRESVEEGVELDEILVQISPGFYVLPASSGVPEMANLSMEEQAFLTDALEQIMGGFDYVLIDCAAGIGDSVLWFNRWAHFSAIVLSSEPTSMTDAYALIKVMAAQEGKREFYLVINNVKTKKEGGEVFSNMAAVLNKFLRIEPELLGILPSDPTVVRAIRAQKPFMLSTPGAKASMAVKVLADQIMTRFSSL